MKKLKFVFIGCLGLTCLMGCCNNQQVNSTPNAVLLKQQKNEVFKDNAEIILPVFSVKITSLRVFETATYLLKGETYQIVTSYTPVNASNVEIEYVSNNTSVATVDKKGLVTAVGIGNTSIKVVDRVTNLENTVQIFVGNSISKANAKTLADNILLAQESQQLGNIDKLRVEESYDFQKTTGGRVLKNSSFTQSMNICKSEAYFKISSYDRTVKVEDGGAEYLYSEWVFVTNSSYRTYIYHINGSVKNYMVLDVSNFIGVENGRYVALLTILDNIFTSGRKIIDNQFEDVLSVDMLERASNGSNHASAGSGDLFFTIKQNGQSKVSNSEESTMEIPAGTQYSISDNLRLGFNDNYLVYKNIVETLSYSLSGTSYKEIYNVGYEFDTKKVDTSIPDRKDYLEVDNIFDL